MTGQAGGKQRRTAPVARGWPARERVRRASRGVAGSGRRHAEGARRGAGVKEGAGRRGKHAGRRMGRRRGSGAREELVRGLEEEGRDKRREGVWAQGPNCKNQRTKRQVEGSGRKKGKDGEGGCKRQGVGKENSQGKIRVWRLGVLGPVVGLLSINSQNVFILQI